MLCKATAGMGVPISVSPCIGATCPFIIFESADIDSAVDGVIETAFKKKKEVIHIKTIFTIERWSGSYGVTSEKIFNSPFFSFPIRSTGCCACRRVCWKVLWPVSSCVWEG